MVAEGRVKYYFLDKKEYRDEKAKISSKKEYLAFQKKWFSGNLWPQKSDEVWEAEMILNENFSLKKDGHEWGKMFTRDELHPDELYEMYSVLYGLWVEYLYPELLGEPKTRENNWYQICPACQIYTHDLGAEKCPLCSRKPIYKKEIVITRD